MRFGLWAPRWRRAVWLAAASLLGLAVWSSVGLALAEQTRAPLLQLTDHPSHDVRPAWSADGSRVAYQSNRAGKYQIWVMRPDGSEQRRLSQGEADDRHPAWSPDGQRLAFDSGDDQIREIWVMDADGRNHRQVTSLGAFSSFPTWSPDGSKLAFFLYRDGVLDLWLVNADSTAARPLTSGLADQRRNACTFACHGPAWSADGSTLAFSGGDHRTVWTLRLGAMDPVQVTSGETHGHFPWFLADGRLAFVEEHVTSSEAWTNVWVIDPTGRRAPELWLEKVRVQGPYAFSPDGQQMVFHSPRAGNFDIYLADLTVPGALEALQTPQAGATVAPGLREQPRPTPPAAEPDQPSPAVASPALEPAAALGVLAAGLGVGLAGIVLARASLRRARRRR